MEMTPARQAGEKDDGSPIFSFFDEDGNRLTHENCLGYVMRQEIHVYFPKDKMLEAANDNDTAE